MQAQAYALSDYYKSAGDNANAAKYKEVGDMFGVAVQKIDAIMQKIRNNLDNPDIIISEVKKDIQDLRNYLKEIIKKIIGAPYCGDKVCDTATKTLHGMESANVTIKGSTYAVTLAGVSGSTTAVVRVGTDTKSISKGTQQNVGGLDVYVDDVVWLSTIDQTMNVAKLILGENSRTCPADCRGQPW